MCGNKVLVYKTISAHVCIYAVISIMILANFVLRSVEQISKEIA